MNPTIIASYPRSGSTWLRFILCNLLYPDIQHDFDSVNKHIPAIDNADDMKIAIEQPTFYKTHSLRHGQNIIHLHRHVGDVLISEYWYKQKFHADGMTLFEYLIVTDYGKNWRDSIDFYFPCAKSISYDQLEDCMRLKYLIGSYTIEEISAAIEKSSFSKMQKAEEKGFGIYPTGSPEIKFIRKGTTGQWRELDAQTQNRIIEKNYTQLKALGYL